MSEQLKNCPFCGGEADFTILQRSAVRERDLYGVMCVAETDCGCWCDFRCYSKDEATAQWNTRSPAGGQPEQAGDLPLNLVAAVVDEIDRLGAMKPDEILGNDDVDFLSLLDMAVTLRKALKQHTMPDAATRKGGEPQTGGVIPSGTPTPGKHCTGCGLSKELDVLVAIIGDLFLCKGCIALAANIVANGTDGEARAAFISALPGTPARDGREVEYGWVIEHCRSETNDPEYWCSKYDWIKDHNKAVRFARREDANVIMYTLLQSSIHRICLHAWENVGEWQRQHRVESAILPTTAGADKEDGGAK